MYKIHFFQEARPEKRLITLLVLVIVILVIPFAQPVEVALADTSVCGPITVNTTWSAANNNYIVTCDVQLMSGIKLTIQSGVVVKFDPGTSLQVAGELVAYNVTFTSNNAIPAKGDWGNINFTANSVDAVFDASGNYVSGSTIQDSLIEWGGGGDNVFGAIETTLASPFIHQNIIQNNSTTGIHVIGRSPAKPIIISHNQISVNDGYYSEGGGVYVSAGKVISNTLSNNGSWLGALQGGGIFASASTISDNYINSNRATGGAGGGIYATGSTISGNTVIGNDGSGITATSSQIEDNLVTGNTWCGIEARGNSVVTNNTANTNSSSGICASEGTLVSQNTVNGNTTSGSGGGIQASNATVTGNLISSNSAVDGGGIYSDNSNLIQNTISGNHASGNGGGLYAYSSTTATDNQIEGNTAANGGGIYANLWSDRIPNLTGNMIQSNTANSGGGIYSLGATLRGNTVISNTVQSDGGGIYADGGVVTNNSVSGNTVSSFGHGSGVYLKNVSDFNNNSVTKNSSPSGTAGGISIDGQPQVQYNNLYSNQPYDVEIVSTSVVTATLNYWGQSLCTAIPAQIYDGNDAPPRGKLLYAPSLYTPAPVAQMAVPANLTLASDKNSVMLNWTPLPSIPNIGCRVPGTTVPDLRYRVYYDNDGCAPFDGKGLTQGSSPVDVGASNAITLNGLSSKDYFFTVTAYDYLGRESSYSNSRQRPSTSEELYLPFVIR
jgi:hypothetical protein